MLRVGKYDYAHKLEPVTEGFTNILIHTTGPLSPYQMKDSNGVIMENYWQFSKIWRESPDIVLPISKYDNAVRWKHHAEVHFDKGEITEEYWHWRQKGMSHNRWVRYPMGYKNHSSCLGSVYDGKIISYVEARKKIYYVKYREIAESTNLFAKLKKRLESGENLQINEVDGPTLAEEYPYNTVENGSIAITEEVLHALMENPSQAFGHGYALAASLLGVEFDDSTPQ